MNESFSLIKSSPKITATLSSKFCSLINSRNASAQASGFTPPAFDNILIFCSEICLRFNFITLDTKSVAYPFNGSLLLARAIIDIVISAK